MWLWKLGIIKGYQSEKKKIENQSMLLSKLQAGEYDPESLWLGHRVMEFSILFSTKLIAMRLN
jgi:hypothetical protein